jgi:tryptophan 2,3-dioxygenase
VITIEDMLLQHLRVLESMSPENFFAFRGHLSPASGFQSFQYRALEFLSGAGDATVLDARYFDPATLEWLTAQSEAPTLWGGFELALRQVLDASDDDETLDLVRRLYLEHRSPVTSALHAVAELLLDHDERLAMWRHQHMMLAARQIGARPGTGGSSGIAYLATTQAQRLYPVLWDVRSVL